MVVSSSNPHGRELAIRKRIASIMIHGIIIGGIAYQTTSFARLKERTFREPSCFKPFLRKSVMEHLKISPHFEFNKREEDFPSLREYNDYLEEVEDMTFNLIEGIDAPAIEAKIVQYQEENAEQIMINRARKAEELAAAMAASKGHPAQTDNDVGPSQSSQAGVSGQGQYAPTVPGGQPRPTGMAPQPVPLGVGFDMHGYAVDDEETMKLRAERGGRAGGWSVEFSRKRALEEAFSSIWIC